jgi:D-alanine-D-alanine ligase-like ATP-grasp enzyme
MLTSFVESLNGNIYLQAAHELGYEVKVLDKQFAFAEIRHGSRQLRVFTSNIDVNSFVSFRFSRNKYLASNVLREHLGAIIPRSEMIEFASDYTYSQDDVDRIEACIAEYNGRAVIKPYDLDSAKGVFVLPSGREDIVRALDDISGGKLSTHVMVEEFIKGDEYRLIAFEGVLTDVIRRIPANVVGDGRLSLSALIEAKNKQKSSHVLPLLLVDWSYVHGQELEASSVIPEGKRVLLNKVCNLSKGGDVERVDLSSISEQHASIARTIFDVSQLRLCGIDLISPDISIDPYTNHSGINEINFVPLPEVMYFADIDSPDPLASIKHLIQLALA